MRKSGRFDTTGQNSLRKVREYVQDYVESKRIDTDTMHNEVLEWAMQGFEYKGVVFILVVDPEFWYVTTSGVYPPTHFTVPPQTVQRISVSVYPSTYSSILLIDLL